jgi:N-carbamoylputrescine amidase
MEDLTIAAIQMNAPLGQVEANLAAHVRVAQQAAETGAELICFPELGLTGHWCAGEVWAASEPVPDGPSTQRLLALARELKVFISFGLAERDRGLVYNTQVVVGPDGFIGKQRKLHMSADEYFHFRTGSEIVVLDLGKCRLGIGICYDNMFPEVARIAAVKGAEVYLMPHASRCGTWPRAAKLQARRIAALKAVWRKCYAARAYDNGMFVVTNNQAGHAGDDPETNHAGGILIFDPGGEVIAESQTERIAEETVVGRLQARHYDRRRTASCFNLQTRRPEIYGEICKPTG